MVAWTYSNGRIQASRDSHRAFMRKGSLLLIVCSGMLSSMACITAIRCPEAAVMVNQGSIT